MRRAGIHSAGLWQLLALVVFLHMLPDWMLRCLVSAVRQPTKKKVTETEQWKSACWRITRSEWLEWRHGGARRGGMETVRVSVSSRVPRGALRAQPTREQAQFMWKVKRAGVCGSQVVEGGECRAAVGAKR